MGMQERKGIVKGVLERPEILVKRLFKNISGNPFICTSYQAEFLLDVILKLHDKYQFIASTRAGKSEITSIIAILLALLYPGERIQIISPTWRQSQIVFKKIRSHVFESMEVAGQLDTRNEFSNQEINFHNKSQIGCLSVGGARKGGQVLGFGGSVLILDESEEIEDDIYVTKILRMLASADRQAILIELGTPHKSNHFKDSYQAGFHKIYQVPYTMAVKEGIINEKEILYLRGQLTPIEFRVWYEAEFPDEDEDSLFALTELTIMRKNEIKIDNGLRVLGVDVARFGMDKTVFTYMQIDDEDNVEIKDIWFTEKKDTMQTVGKILELNELCKFDKINVDVIGLGSGVYDRLFEQEYPVFASHFGQTPSKEYTQFEHLQKKRDWIKKQRTFNFLNKKAEQYFRLKKLLAEGKISISANKDMVDRLFSDLSRMKYEFSSAGKIKISEWERASPDFADSLVYAIWKEGGDFFMDFGKVGGK